MTDKNIVRRIAFFVSLILVASVFILIYLAHFGNINEVFTDVVNEFTALDGSNKAPERALVYLLSVVGVVIISAHHFLVHSIQTDFFGNDERTHIKPYVLAVIVIAVSFCTFLFVYGSVNWVIIAAMFIAAMSFIKNKYILVESVSFYFLTLYGICGIYRLYVLLGGIKSLDITIAAIIALVISVVFVVITKDNKLLLKGVLLLQAFIPLLLLVYLMDRYYVSAVDSFIEINIPKRVQAVILALVAMFVIEAVYLIIKKWQTSSSLNDVLSYGACVAIMTFNRYIGTGSILPSDIHHPYENITAYFQIVKHGAKPFVDYIPASGFYSIVQGAIFDFFGHGIASYYFVTENLMYLFAVCIIVFLLRRQLKAEWVLLITLFFLYVDFMDDYNRIVFILPNVLLLTWPKLIENKNLWLKAWFISSFLHGLYYPVYGAAVCVAFAPFGIWQIYTYAKSGQLLKDIKTVKFWIWWIVCFAPVLASTKLLLGLIRHMKAMSGQTEYADGISRFGQVIPDVFLPYISNLPIRLVAYYLVTFLVPVILVWLSVILFLNNGQLRINNKKVVFNNPSAGFLSISFGLMLLVAFSFTIVRYDIRDIYARSWGVIAVSMVMVVILVSRFKSMDKILLGCIFAFTIFSISLVTKEGVSRIDSDSKLDAFYTVPDGYVYVKNDPIERFGEGFVHPDLYQYLENWYVMYQNYDKKQAYLGGLFDYGPYFLFDMKGAAVIETPGTLKGYDAVQETVDMVRANGSYIGGYINPIDNYYLYHWLVTSGEYIFNPDNKYFIPNAGQKTVDEIRNENKNLALKSDGGSVKRTAGSWGSSMETLESIFSDANIGYNIAGDDYTKVISFDRAFDGDEADFMYIEFDGVNENFDYTLFDHGGDYVQDVTSFGIFKELLKKDYNRGVEVEFMWTGDDGVYHTLSARLDEGKLLMPLGGGQSWLLNTHTNIAIAVKQDGENILVPKISNVRMLKLREIQ